MGKILAAANGTNNLYPVSRLQDMYPVTAAGNDVLVYFDGQSPFQFKRLDQVLYGRDIVKTAIFTIDDKLHGGLGIQLLEIDSHAFTGDVTFHVGLAFIDNLFSFLMNDVNRFIIIIGIMVIKI